MTTRTSLPGVPWVAPDVRPHVRGKFIFVGEEKLYVRGVTYGPFRPDAQGDCFHPEVVERDFAQMTAVGVNAVRTYFAPPRWLLDAAQRHGLRVMVGLSAEEYVGHLNSHRKDAPDVEGLVRLKVRACGGHPAVLCYAIGNEIPASIGRWFGGRRIERYVERLYRAVKAEDPDGLVTYVSYPSTEYLQLPFLDFVCFNVYLEAQGPFAAYLSRLHNIAGDRPLVMSEIGLDSLRNGEESQARILDWQIRTSFASGCAGVFVYAWTDEWYNAGADVMDWRFGITSRDRTPKPALSAVRAALAEVPFPPSTAWPRISVVVCTHNGARTIRDCLEGLGKLAYPSFEVIVVDDGSTDSTPAIASEYDFRLVRTENRGLSSARNTGLAAATGEIVAYIDDDAYPDPHWLTYLAATLQTTTHAGVGGPNLAPPGDGPIAETVAHAPGGPVHVLLTDSEAEHIPGCNMAFRKASLEAIGGFDPQFRTAGDDVDVCWRLQEKNWTLGYNAAALVWHHRRNSVRAYWKQQSGYGRAEALLERKWPERYNAAGHIRWSGRVYANALTPILGRVERIYHGTWGSAPFQSLYQPAASVFWLLPMMPEWYLIILAMFGLAALGIAWSALLVAFPLLALAISAPVIEASLRAGRETFFSSPHSRVVRLRRRALLAFLHLVQPLARLSGRLSAGLTPWRLCASGHALPWRRTFAVWTETWQAPETRLHHIEAMLRAAGACALRGGGCDRWDLQVRGGTLGSARLLMAVEEHGRGRQLIRLRTWPRCSGVALVLLVLLGGPAVWAWFDHAWGAAAVLGVTTLLLALRTYLECAVATGALLLALEQPGNGT